MFFYKCVPIDSVIDVNTEIYSKVHKMKLDNNEAIAVKWFQAFNEQNLEKLLSLYDDNAEHYSPKLKVRLPETKGYVRGKAALGSWWQDAFDRLPTLHYSYTSLTANGDRVFMEYIRTVVGEPEMQVAEVLEIKNGLIVASRVYHG
jgi:hypothetical protein